MKAALVMLLLVGVAWFLVAASDNPPRVTFQSCEEAREAGAPLPLTAADPGWNTNLDPDGDGAAC